LKLIQNQELQKKISGEIQNKIMTELNIANLEISTINAAIEHRLQEASKEISIDKGFSFKTPDKIGQGYQTEITTQIPKSKPFFFIIRSRDLWE
jgi:hypothetical protein